MMGWVGLAAIILFNTGIANTDRFGALIVAIEEDSQFLSKEINCFRAKERRPPTSGLLAALPGAPGPGA